MAGDGSRMVAHEGHAEGAPCRECGGAIPSAARFCPWCATAVAATGGQARKTVTLVFSDLVGFTPLGEALEPEALREVMQRFYDLASRAVGAHGGRVASFAGDAVMAVFGIPVLHEDDALRAVRAALDLAAGLEGLNGELARGWGVRLAARTGVNTGEVVVGDGSLGALVGDAVNVAARLEQVAAPGEVLVSGATHGLVRDRVHAEELPALELKGKREPVAAWRLLRLRDVGDSGGAAGRQLVGRLEEMALLRGELAGVRSEGAPRVVTLLGPPGIGKSRLAQAFADAVAGDSPVVRGRCPEYGDDLTFLPLREIVAQAAAARGDEPPRALGPDGADAPLDEVFSAARGVLGRLAGDGPAVVVLEDVHRAEPALLETLERVWAEPSSGPLLLVATARPELMDERPGWAGTVRTIGALGAADAAAVAASAPAAGRLGEDALARAVAAGEGNPLFVEQMVALLAERPGAAALRPPSIEALLAARLDQLPDDERHLAERAAVVGAEFAPEALPPLLDDVAAPALADLLERLVRRDVVRRGVGGTGGAAFAHGLVRDAAYARIPKAVRASLHERHAVWLEERGGRDGDADELVGHHLEQAALALREVHPGGADAARLAGRAAPYLAAVGRDAAARGDARAGAGLLGRAVALLPSGEARTRLLPELGGALLDAGRLTEADAILAESAEAAATADDRRIAAMTDLLQARLRAQTGEMETRDFRDAVASALARLEAEGDAHGVALAHHELNMADWFSGRSAARLDAFDAMHAAVRNVGEARLEAELLGWFTGAISFGPTPVPEALGRLSAVLEEAAGRGVRCPIGWLGIANLSAMDGRFADARRAAAQAFAGLDDLGLALMRAAATQNVAWMEVVAGDLGAAESLLRDGLARLDAMGAPGYGSTNAGMLAHVLLLRGQDDEAAGYADTCRRTTHDDDIVSQVLWRRVTARLAAHRGDPGGAPMAEEAARMAADTDWGFVLAGTLVDLAEVRGLGGRPGPARAVAQQARAIYLAKGDRVSAGRVERALEALGRGMRFRPVTY